MNYKNYKGACGLKSTNTIRGCQASERSPFYEIDFKIHQTMWRKWIKHLLLCPPVGIQIICVVLTGIPLILKSFITLQIIERLFIGLVRRYDRSV